MRCERSITTPMSCSIITMLVPFSSFTSRDEARHVLFSSGVHARHRLVEQQQRRLQGERARELDALLQSVREGVDDFLPDVFDLEKIDDVLDDLPLRDLLATARPVIESRR